MRLRRRVCLDPQLRTGIRLSIYTSKGNDSVKGAFCVPVVEAGMVWAPDETFADEMIEEVAAFPNGEYDLVDSMTQALMSTVKVILYSCK